MGSPLRSSSNICATGTCQRQKLSICPSYPACEPEVRVWRWASEHRLGPGRAGDTREQSKAAPGADSRSHLEAQVQACQVILHDHGTENLGQKQMHPFVALENLNFYLANKISKEIAVVLLFTEAIVRVGFTASNSLLFLRMNTWNQLQAAAGRIAPLLRNPLVFIPGTRNSSHNYFPL